MARKRYFYHASPVEVRQNIARAGLSPGLSASYGPPAVYVFRERFFAEDYRYNVMADVWKVDLSGFDVQDDPEDPEGAAYVEERVPPGRLEFLGTYMNGEPVVS